MLSRSIKDTEAVLGRKLTWWERTGYLWDSLVTDPSSKAGGGALTNDYNETLLPGQLEFTGKAADVIYEYAPWGGDVGQLAQASVNAAEQGTGAATTFLKTSGPWGPLGIIAALIAAYLWLKG